MGESKKDFEERKRNAKTVSDKIAINIMAQYRKGKDTLNYEVRCRKCGQISEYGFSVDADCYSIKNLKKYMFDHSNRPAMIFCKVCEKMTVQDYIAYNIIVFDEPLNPKS